MIRDFLSHDHSISLDAVVGLLNAELQWCYQNDAQGMSAEFRSGFIKGLEQAKYLIIEAAKKSEADYARLRVE